jgi:hypothetical protein
MEHVSLRDMSGSAPTEIYQITLARDAWRRVVVLYARKHGIPPDYVELTPCKGE